MTDLIRRPSSRSQLMTRELRRKARLSPSEAVRAYPWAQVAIAPGPMVAVGIVLPTALSGPRGLVIAAIAGGGVLLFGALCAALVRCFEMPDERKARKFQALADRSRRVRPHAGIEATRLRELDRAYARFSVWVERVGPEVRVLVLRHVPKRTGLLPFTASKTKRAHNPGSGYWHEEDFDSERVADPTLPKVERVVRRVQELAERLEEEAYQDALSAHKLDVLALTAQPPPASPRAKARLTHTHPEFEGELAELDDEKDAA